ncbi:hypothetical protein KC351_g72 [Hortaea werneckii]|nr:hypothetical protein KC351_g72 [Hortaea werneckii]
MLSRSRVSSSCAVVLAFHGGRLGTIRVLLIGMNNFHELIQGALLGDGAHLHPFRFLLGRRNVRSFMSALPSPAACLLLGGILDDPPVSLENDGQFVVVKCREGEQTDCVQFGKRRVQIHAASLQEFAPR